MKFEATTNVGLMAERSGNWHPVFTHDTDLLWLCPNCGEQANILANEIHKIIKTEHFYFPNILRLR